MLVTETKPPVESLPDVKRPCPGRHDIPCGSERIKGGPYCKPHTREYQRERYANTRKKADEVYVPRPKTRVVVDICTCCGRPSEGVPMIQMSEGRPPICDNCFVIYDFVTSRTTMEHLRAILTYVDKYKPRTTTERINGYAPRDFGIKQTDWDELQRTSHEKIAVVEVESPKEIEEVPSQIDEVKNIEEVPNQIEEVPDQIIDDPETTALWSSFVGLAAGDGLVGPGEVGQSDDDNW